MTQYFANQRLGEKLEKLGIESHFEFSWRKDEIIESVCMWNGVMTYENLTTAFHWSDICLPENAKKIWTSPFFHGLDSFGNPAFIEWEMSCQNLYKKILREKDWQSFVESEVDKRLNERI